MQILKDYREQHGFTQLEMAGKLGVSQSMIQLVENGKRGLGRQASYKLHQLDPKVFKLDLLLCPDCAPKAA